MGMNITKAELNAAYENLKKQSFELGFRKFFDDVTGQLILLLLEQKEDAALNLVNSKILELWQTYTKERIDDVDQSIRPKYVFSEKIFSEIRDIREEYSSLAANSSVEDINRYKDLLEKLGDIGGNIERERQRSAFGFLLKALQWGIIVSFASLTSIFYFISPSVYVVPIPFAVTTAVALIGYGVVRKYPDISLRILMLMIQAMAVILSVVITIIQFLLRG